MNSLIWTVSHIAHSDSKDVVILTCQVERIFTFLEGQFMMLQTLIDGKLVKRAYSIYSTNQQLQETKTISFCIKRKEWWLFSTRSTQITKIGMKIDMIWPIGRFVDDGASRNYLFVSVGSGLSPCFSIYQQLIRSDNYDKIANIFGERYLNHIPSEVLDDYSIQNKKIHNQLFLSKKEINENKQAILKNGYVQDGLDSALEFLETTELTVFICGLPVMCEDVAQLLQKKWILKNRLVVEKY